MVAAGIVSDFSESSFYKTLGIDHRLLLGSDEKTAEIVEYILLL